MREPIELYSIDGTLLSSFAAFDLSQKVFIVRPASFRKIRFQKKVTINSLLVKKQPSKLLNRVEINKRLMNKMRTNKDIPLNLKPAEICQRYNINYGQYLYLSSKFDINLKKQDQHANTIPLQTLTNNDEVLHGFMKEIVDRICLVRSIDDERITKNDYIWLWCFLVYKTLPLTELAFTLKKIFNPKASHVVVFEDVRSTLINISKSCQPLELSAEHNKFARIILDELRLNNCLNSRNDLIVDNFYSVLLEENKLLLYLNQVFTKSSWSKPPLTVRFQSIGIALEIKQQFINKLLKFS